ncbi:MAG: hypothetical protein QGF33_11135 [Alphaproteobacteria bacterium]|nr:hypothetical protein [Alphaproteobacteria bacterium]
MILTLERRPERSQWMAVLSPLLAVLLAVVVARLSAVPVARRRLAAAAPAAAAMAAGRGRKKIISYDKIKKLSDSKSR